MGSFPGIDPQDINDLDCTPPCVCSTMNDRSLAATLLALTHAYYIA